MTREEANRLMAQMVQNQNLRKHAWAVEAIMSYLCDYLRDKHPELPASEFDNEEWAIVGLLHDADYELIGKDPTKHTLVTEERLRPMGVSDRIINAIKAHHDTIKPTRDNLMESAVYAADELSGLITAVALVKERKLANVSVESVMSKFPQKNFAAGARRDQIETGVRELNLSLEEFVGIALKAMQVISDQLEL